MKILSLISLVGEVGHGSSVPRGEPVENDGTASSVRGIMSLLSFIILVASFFSQCQFNTHWFTENSFCLLVAP